MKLFAFNVPSADPSHWQWADNIVFVLAEDKEQAQTLFDPHDTGGPCEEIPMDKPLVLEYRKD